jgi:hypothetical protein
MRLRANVSCRKRHVSSPKIRSVNEGFSMGGITCCQSRKEFEVLWDLSGSCNMLPLLLGLLRSQIHYAYKRVGREKRRKLVVSRTRVVSKCGIATFQGKIAGNRTHRPRPPWNHDSKRLQNNFPIPVNTMRDDRLIRTRLR